MNVYLENKKKIDELKKQISEFDKKVASYKSQIQEWKKEIDRLKSSLAFTKSDLRTGYLCVSRDGTKYVYFADTETEYYKGGVLVNKDKNFWMEINEYNDDLTHRSSGQTLSFLKYSDLDIMKVYRQSHPYSITREYDEEANKLIWEREE